MDEAVAVLISEVNWNQKTLLRTKLFYTDADLIVLYKAHSLSHLEFRTLAVYHGMCELLAMLDAVHVIFLQDVGLAKAAELIEFIWHLSACGWISLC